MKITYIIISLILLMLIPLLFSFFMSQFYSEPTLRDKLSENQINEISEKFKIDIMPNEKISTEFFPSVMQATIYLKIHIENIESKEDFLSRFRGTIKKVEPHITYDTEKYSNAYNMELFNLERIPKDYMCYLFLSDKDGNSNAMFYVSGYIPELNKIYNFSYNHLQPFLSNRIFISLVIIEFGLVMLLILNNFIRHLKKHRKSQEMI